MILLIIKFVVWLGLLTLLCLVNSWLNLPVWWAILSGVLWGWFGAPWVFSHRGD